MKDKNEAKDVDALLVHIEHSKPIEISEFVTSLNALGNLFSAFAQRKGGSKEMAGAKLYVEKIEEGCIDITLCEMVSSCLLPFMENMNIVMEFSAYIKRVLGYFMNGDGTKPELSVQECKCFKDVLTVTAGDNKGLTSIGAICRNNKGIIYNNCTFNFIQSNSSQNQLEREIDAKKSVTNSEDVHHRVLMRIYQVRSDAETNVGNKAIIDDIYPKKKLSVLFDSDELKESILFSDANPTRNAFQVDVKVQTIDGKPRAYKVTALHDVVDLDD